MTWGPVNDGLQIGIELPSARIMSHWRPGSKVAYKLLIKNASNQPKLYTYTKGREFGWYPELYDKDGNRAWLMGPPYSGHVEIRERSLGVGETAEVRSLAIDLPETFKPGRYSMKQRYRVTNDSQELLPMEVSVEIEIGAPAVLKDLNSPRLQFR